jgi:hypothetical protein
MHAAGVDIPLLTDPCILISSIDFIRARSGISHGAGHQAGKMGPRVISGMSGRHIQMSYRHADSYIPLVDLITGQRSTISEDVVFVGEADP